jgi:maleate cis-trans isomerase
MLSRRAAVTGEDFTFHSLGLPVLSAATATVHDLLIRLGLSPEVPDAGVLLSGAEVLAAGT